MIYRFIKAIAKITPKPIKTMLKKCGCGGVVYFLCDKYEIELAFQKQWVDEFTRSKQKVLEYWKKYRYLDDIERICEISDSSNILDIGCGICSVLHYVKGRRVGIDPLADEYEKIYTYPKDITIIKGVGEKLPFPKEYFDIVFCSNVLDHVTDPERTLEKVCRVLKTDGYFVLTVEVFNKKTKRDPAHPGCFTEKDVFSFLKNKWHTEFIGRSPALGIKNYVNNVIKPINNELILILKKIN